MFNVQCSTFNVQRSMFNYSVTYPHCVRQCLPLCPPMSGRHCLNRGHRFGSRTALCPARSKSDDAAKVRTFVLGLSRSCPKCLEVYRNVSKRPEVSRNVPKRTSNRVTHSVSYGSPISSMIKRTSLGVKLRKFLLIRCRRRGLTLSQNLSFFIAVSFDRSGKYIMASSLLP